MHYCVHLLTKELPTKDEIEKIVQPYNSEIVYGNSDGEGKMINYPIFTWNWYEIGGRYKAALKLKVGEEDDENWEYYRWKYWS